MSQISIKTITFLRPPGRRMTEVVGPISGSLGRILEAHFGISVGDFHGHGGYPTMVYPLVNKQIKEFAIENGDLVRGFTHEKWWIFPQLC